MKNVRLSGINRFRILTTLLLAVLLQAAPLFAESPPVKVKGYRAGLNKEGVRIVIELSGAVDYQVRSIKDSSMIYVDIYDAQLAGNFKHVNTKPDKMLKKCSAKNVNFRQVRFAIPLAYGVPVENVNYFHLDSPNRIVIDVYRDYHNFIQFFITKNIIWTQTERAANGRFTLINELFVNQKSPGVRVKIGMAKDYNKKRMKVSDMVKKSGAIAGINGGYFGKGGQNLGLVVVDGKVKASAVSYRPPRTAFAIDFDNRILFNRVMNKGSKLITKWGKPWTNVVIALGAGPRLISNKKVHITAKEEGLGKGGNDITRRTGRSTLGVTKKGHLVLMSASGFRSNAKDGMKLIDLANYMSSRGVTDAMNLDGGGSTAMSVLGTLVSKPPMQGKYQRPVANAILIFDKAPIISPLLIGTDPVQLVMPADGVTEKTLRILVTDKNENPVPDKTAVALASGVGLFEKKYYYTQRGFISVPVKSVRAPGNYSIKIDCGPVRKFLPVKLEEGKPGAIFVKVLNKSVSARTSSSKKKYFKENGRSSGKNRRIYLKALLRDEFKNPLKSRVVEFEVVEGKGVFKSSKVFTKPDGVAEGLFVLQSKSAKLMIKTAGLEPVTVDI